MTLNANIQAYANKTYPEVIDLKKAKITVKYWDRIINQLPEHRRNYIYEGSNKKGFIDPLITLKKIIKSCNLKEVIYPFGYNNVTYKPSANDVFVSDNQTGRLYCANASLQNIPREIRGTISSGYVDVDVVNAHPVFLAQYCKKNNIRCDKLDYYISNRDEVLQDIVNLENIQKDQAKTIMLKCLNGGDDSTISNLFFLEFKEEISNIHTSISNIPEVKNIYAKIKRRRDFNSLGSLMNNILCNIENTILLHSVHFLSKKGFKVGVLVFDGMMIELHHLLNQDVLHELSLYIKDQTGYDIQYAIKPFEKLDLTEFENLITEEVEPQLYPDDKDIFEKKHCKIMFPPVYCTIRDEYKIELQKRKDFMDSHNHIYTNVKSFEKSPDGDMISVYKKKKFCPLWVEDEYIKIYDHIDFIPTPLETPSNVFNLFRGFKVQDVPLPDDFEGESNVYVQKFLHLANAVLNNNPKLLDYYISYCANKLQRPAFRSRVCMILYTDEKGIGKNRLLDTFNKILGDQYFVEMESAKKNLFSDHSTLEEGRLLLIVNEAKGIDNLENADILKSRITTETVLINPKGIQAYNIANLCDYIMTTNNEKVVEMDDTERRFLVIECGVSLMQNSDYFTDYTTTVVENPTALRCIYEFLMQWDIQKHIPNYDWQKARPITEFQKKSVYNHRPREWLFLEYLVYEKYQVEDTISLTNQDIWTIYVNFCERNNFKLGFITSNKFHTTFQKVVIKKITKIPEYSKIISKTKNNGIRKLSFDKIKIIEYLDKYVNIHDDTQEVSDDDE